MKNLINRSFLIKHGFIFWTPLTILLFASFSFGQTEGPSMPEVQTFTPHDAKDLVNPFTGDFTYNITLLEVGGYPVNISYHSGAGMHDDAGWVGLGWSLNPGAINRNVRGLPDDFKGEELVKKFSINDNTTIGLKTGPNFEYAGLGTDNISVGIGQGIDYGISYNNRRGFDLEIGRHIGLKVGIKDEIFDGSLSLDYGLSTRDGAYLKPGLGLDSKLSPWSLKKGELYFSSKEGLKYISIDGTYKKRLPTKYKYSFISPTYTPSFEMPTIDISGTVDGKLGGEVYGLKISGHLKFYFSVQTLETKIARKGAFGYLYAQHAGSSDVLDLNREQEGPYMEEDPHLPITSFTYDLFYVSAHGLNGVFRPQRSDIGILYDPRKTTFGAGPEIGFEVGVGNIAHPGVDVTINSSFNSKQKWINDNEINNIFAFAEERSDAPLFEPIYFKQVGELTADNNQDLFDRLGGFEPARFEISNGEVHNRLRNLSGEVATIEEPQQTQRLEREPRGNLFSYLTAEDASATGLHREIRSYEQGIVPSDDFVQTYTYNFQTYPRVDSIRQPHHLSEITVTRDDGVRYVYGIPSYNIYKEEVSFDVDGRPESTGLPDNLVQFSGQENSTDNSSGKYNYYNSEITPPYAYSYRLTAILSPDYTDLGDNGPTPDDFGSYTLFNYTRVQTEYRWKVPYERDRAFFSEGSRSDAEDQRGSFEYGTKEVWYLHSIQTKNFVAEIYNSPRNDGLGALPPSEEEVAEEQRLFKLDSILLFTTADRFQNGPAAVALKKVFFDYDYSLCPGIPNHMERDSGKLTLKKISYSYQNAEKERLSPFEFGYAVNRPFNPVNVDRWGTYKGQNEELPSNVDFPYVDQDREHSDTYASVWQLTDITLPSSSKLKIDYEADDYAFVQDKKAMDMIKIKGFGASREDCNPCSRSLYQDISTTDEIVHNNYLFFHLREPLENDEDLAVYLEDVGEIYFKARVELFGQRGTGGSPFSTELGQYEEISGFFPMGTMTPGEDYGRFNDTVGWIRMDDPDQNNPIAEAAWQRLRKNLSHLMYPSVETPGDWANELQIFFQSSLGPVIGQISSIVAIEEEFSDRMTEELRGMLVDTTNSFLRLNNFTHRKLGGGQRVKRITLTDEWGNMTGDPSLNFQYGLEYDYSVVSENGLSISSGVASYEPLLGGDENPWVQPVRYRENRIFAADLLYHEVTPFGEGFFPSPQIGYSRIKEKSLSHEGINQASSGYTLYQYYTAQDFPTITLQTDKDHISSEFPGLVISYTEKKATASQGFYVELNDMHGKLKSQKEFAEGNPDTPVAGTEYFYKTDPENSNRLSNETEVITDSTARMERSMIGVDFDFAIDCREFTSENLVGGAQINLDAFAAGMFPLFLVSLIPDLAYSLTQFKGVTTTKVVYRSGILDSVVAYERGTSVITRNIAFDGKTGRAVITKVNNEFDQPYYETNIPAHWVYEGMDGAYLNTGVKLNDQAIEDGQINIENAERYFIQGDEVLLYRLDEPESIILEDEEPREDIIFRSPEPFTAWVYWVEDDAIHLIDKTGNNERLNGNFNLRISRSGHRNMASATLGKVITLDNPITDPNQLSFTRVIQSDAVDYQQHWQTYKVFNAPTSNSLCYCEPTRDSSGNLVVQIFYDFLRRLPSLVNLEEEITDPLFNLYLTARMGAGTKTYHSEINNDHLDIVIWNQDTGRECNVCIRRVDGQRFSPFTTISWDDPPEVYFDRDEFLCVDNYSFQTNAFWQDERGSEETTLIISSDCFPILRCGTEMEWEGLDCDPEERQPYNPFLFGTLGNWRPQSTYKLLDLRTRGRADTAGVYEDYVPFWDFPEGFSIFPESDPSRWVKSYENTLIDPFGKGLETRNALGIYSATLYGYGYSLPVATAYNARLSQIAFDNFEDYTFNLPGATPIVFCPFPAHWKFEPSEVTVDEEISHTGLRSLRLEGLAAVSRMLEPECDPELRSIPEEPTYTLQECDLVPDFTPLPGTYLLSAWVRDSSESSAPTLTYENARVEVRLNGSSPSAFSFTPQGHIIDGWQQVNGLFELSDTVNTVEIRLVNTGTTPIFFDDIRIQPSDARMETYVYDPFNLRLKAVLDPNNFSTLFEYDREGQLTRTKKETERGIMTLQEVRASKVKRTTPR